MGIKQKLFRVILAFNTPIIFLVNFFNYTITSKQSMKRLHKEEKKKNL